MKTIFALAVSATLLATAAAADPITVGAQSNLYYPSSTDGTGVAPPTVAILGGQTITFPTVTGSVILNHGTGDTSNGPDGNGQGNSLSVNAASGISGINLYQAGALLGVFVNAATPTGTAPATLTYANAASEAFGLANPLLNQVFFIGDGLTGTGSGTVQSFLAPTGATALRLGFADASAYSGSPGAFGDNLGSFSVSYTVAGAGAVPEPATWAMMMLGIGALGFVMRRQQKQNTRATFA